MSESKIACHTFLCLLQPKPTQNWPIETEEMPKESGLFDIVFLPAPLYIQWYQFIILQITLPIPSHLVPSNVLMVFKKVTYEPLEHCGFDYPQDISWRTPHQTCKKFFFNLSEATQK